MKPIKLMLVETYIYKIVLHALSEQNGDHSHIN